MAFVSDIPTDGTMSIMVNSRENDLETEVRVPIGHDPDEGLQYSVIVAFYTLSDEEYGEDAMEVTFEIVAIGDGDPIYYANGRETKAFLDDDETRGLVLEIVAFHVHEVLARRRPSSVHMATKTANTPRKALVKYECINSAIVEAGYYGGQVNAFNAIDKWMFVAI